MSSTSTSHTVNDYQVGIICALDIELAAVEAMLDEVHDTILKREPHDSNSYSFGRIHKHNVVIACLPSGIDGLAAAASVAKDLVRTIPQLRFGLLVGIGGGIPDLPNGVDIRLGDVVVSRPTGTTGGIVQYDKGKMKAGNDFEPKGTVNPPPTVLLTAMQSLQARHRREDSKMIDYLTEMFQKYPKMKKAGYQFPGRNRDLLFEGGLDSSSTKNGYVESNADEVIQREERESDDPEIHYGIIASGNQVIKNAVARDTLREAFGAICVEMEAAGLMKEFPCLVIRGICDYADSYKNDMWHGYAAATAAAYTKELLSCVSVIETDQTSSVEDIEELKGIFTQGFSRINEYHDQQVEHNRRQNLRYQTERERRCHQALKTSNYQQFKNINGVREERTCVWVLEHERFQQWLSNENNDVLWISADPGCGKSVLSRSLIDQDLRSISKVFNLSVCYYFFKDNETQSTLAPALCAILHQLFIQQPRLIEYAMETWHYDGNEMCNEVDALWRILGDAANDTDADPIVCVFDALDECRTHSRNQLIGFLRAFHGQTTHVQSDTYGYGRLKFLVTSRPYSDIEDAMVRAAGSPPLIRLRGEDENDQISHEIDIVVRSRVQQLATELNLQADIANSLEQKLLGMNHRTYLWLHLAMDDIRTKFRNSLRPQYESIASLPASVNEAYEQILGRVAIEMKETVKKILLIIVGASRSLTLDEMAMALDIATSSTRLRSFTDFSINSRHLEKNIRQWCGLFVFINNERINLIHQTAKEFLVPETELNTSDTTAYDGGKWRHCLSSSDVRTELARIYMQYLCLAEFNTLEGKSSHLGEFNEWWKHHHGLAGPAEKYKSLSNENSYRTLFDLAADSWAFLWHCIESNESVGLKEELEMLYDTNSYRCDHWNRAVRLLDEHNRTLEGPSLNALQIAAFNGHRRKLRELLEVSKMGLDSRSQNGWTILMIAAQRGYSEIVQDLIDHGADPHVQIQLTWLQSCEPSNVLEVACKLGHVAIVQKLINVNVDVNQELPNFCGSALSLASFYGYEEVVELLIQSGADVTFHDKRTKHSACALFKAVGEGHTEVARLLLEQHASMTCCEDKDNVLCAALRGRPTRLMLELLIKYGAIVNPVQGKNPLYVAAFYNDIVSMRQLIDLGASAESQSKGLWSALEIAAYYGHSAIARFLLDQGANVNAPSVLTGSPLHAACSRGHPTLAELLISEGAIVNLLVEGHGTPLIRASDKGKKDVVGLLLGHGADPNIRDAHYGSALHAAATGGHAETLKLLLEHGGMINLISDAKGTPLICSAIAGSEEQVKLLLSLGADVNIFQPGVGNALHIASLKGYSTIVKLLIEHGADVNIKH